MKRFIILALVLALAGCNRDYGECYKLHVQHYSNPIYTTMCVGSGANMICTPILAGYDEGDETVCDEWQYPNGDGPRSKK